MDGIVKNVLWQEFRGMEHILDTLFDNLMHLNIIEMYIEDVCKLANFRLPLCRYIYLDKYISIKCINLW